jgi:hypothetical protein
MNVLNLILTAGVGFLVLIVVFRPIEWAFPAKAGQRFFRPDWAIDLCFFLGQYLVPRHV